VERLEARAAAAERAKTPPHEGVFAGIQREYDRLCRLKAGEGGIEGTPHDVQQAWPETQRSQGAEGEAKGQAYLRPCIAGALGLYVAQFAADHARFAGGHASRP
jgi:hypothetical protein